MSPTSNLISLAEYSIGVFRFIWTLLGFVPTEKFSQTVSLHCSTFMFQTKGYLAFIQRMNE